MRDWPQGVRGAYETAVFLDRDGTINRDTHFPHRSEDLTFLDHSLAGLRVLSQLPVAIIIVSNQAGIGLGLFTKQDMHEFNVGIRQAVEDAGGRIDAIYYCPDLEPKHLAPGVKPSECSKPAPGMLYEAADDWGLNLRQSFMVGDKASDVAAGAAAGCSTLLVKEPSSGTPDLCHPDFIVSDLMDAAETISAVLDRAGSPRTAC